LVKKDPRVVAVYVEAGSFVGAPVHPDAVTYGSPASDRCLVLVTVVVEIQGVDEPTLRRVGHDYLRPSDTSSGAEIGGHENRASWPKLCIDRSSRAIQIYRSLLREILPRGHVVTETLARHLAVRRHYCLAQVRDGHRAL
jgi:hypothetical protein